MEKVFTESYLMTIATIVKASDKINAKCSIEYCKESLQRLLVVSKNGMKVEFMLDLSEIKDIEFDDFASNKAYSSIIMKFSYEEGSKQFLKEILDTVKDLNYKSNFGVTDVNVSINRYN